MSRRLTLDETYKCLKSWRELNDKDAYTLLVKSNSGLVALIARKYLNGSLTFDELFSAGNLGLLNAINKFNYKENSIKAFSTYIGVTIENTIKLEFANYNKHKDVISFNEPIGYNEEYDEFLIEETIGTDEKLVEEAAIKNIRSSIIKEVLSNLSERERKIISLRFGLDNGEYKTLEEVASMCNSTIPKIAEEERKILRKIRHPKYSRKLKIFLD